MFNPQASFGFIKSLAAALYLCRKVRKDRNFLIAKWNVALLPGKAQGGIPVLVIEELRYECTGGGLLGEEV